MNYSKTLSVLGVAAVALAVSAADASAQRRGGGGGGGSRGGGHAGPSVGRSAPRGPYAGGSRTVYPGRYYGGFAGPRYITPRIVGIYPYRPYYYPFRPGLTVGFYAGYGYPYYGYYGNYGYSYGYPYAAYPYYYGGYGYGMPPPG